MRTAKFMDEVKRIYGTGSATEHSYRAVLQELFSSFGENITALNEPKRIKCGAPDFLISSGDIIIGHAEAKDIDKDLSTLKGPEAEQKKRYLKALPNLIYTNCLDFEFYRDGKLLSRISIGDYVFGIQPKPANYNALENQLKDFLSQKPQTITSPKDLAERMAGKAILIKDVLAKALIEDAGQETELRSQYAAFKEHLIHDISIEDFADIYAETIAYGMFAGRLHDTTLDTFSRQEALALLPKSNPFLRSLFTYIAGYNLDDRIAWIIDDLAAVFQAADVAKIMAGFGRLTGREDPFLHFYETFLAAYNPAKRKARGVWYTPEPVVNFIVRAVDEVLQTEFGLADGLADTSKVTIDWDTGQTDKKGKRHTIKKEVHRVQILDPATGTGTFLAEVIKQIAPRVQGVAPGMWSSYIEKDLIPRLHGFELLMASYAMCHMKLDMILTEMGYKPTGQAPRLSVYLTNSLEEGEPANQSLPFAQWLSNEVKQANAIKRDMPIMCVIGNPPYSGISQNMGEWISGLIEDYKYVDGNHFGERKHWLHDDYVKFIRLSESLIENNGEGVLGFITNHGYLDNPTFRGMRWHLLNTFDKIHVLDLHGNSNKREVTPEGKPDKNVFDIRQGVAIIVAVKTRGKSKALAEVWHGDSWGGRQEKYQSLEDAKKIECLIVRRLQLTAPLYSFRPSISDRKDEYDGFLGLGEFFPVQGLGYQTSRDDLVVAMNRDELIENIETFSNERVSDDQVREIFFGSRKKGKYEKGDTRQWSLPVARERIRNDPEWRDKIKLSLYRPFDIRPLLYMKEMVDWPRPEVLNNLLKPNVSLIMNRQTKEAFGVLCSDKLTERKIAAVYDGSTTAPLYIHPSEQDLDQARRVNFDNKLWDKLKKQAKHVEYGTPDELAGFDYIYGVLHCPAYRTTYAEFLKIDFPRIPWPASPAEFWDVSGKGTQLRKLHLMEPAAIGETPYPFTGEGDNVVEKPRFEAGRVWINESQFFDHAPAVSWGFFIGGYQPAQKWLQDRKGRALSFDDVKHYQRILKILAETDRIMRTIELEICSESATE